MFFRGNEKRDTRWNTFPQEPVTQMDLDDDDDSGGEQPLYIKEDDEEEPIKEEEASMDSTGRNDTRLSDLHNTTLKTENESEEDKPLVKIVCSQRRSTTFGYYFLLFPLFYFHFYYVSRFYLFFYHFSIIFYFFIYFLSTLALIYNYYSVEYTFNIVCEI